MLVPHCCFQNLMNYHHSSFPPCVCCLSLWAVRPLPEIVLVKLVSTKLQKNRCPRMRGARWWTADQSDPIEEAHQEISPTLKMSPEIAPTAIDTQEDSQGDKRSNDEKSGTSPEKQKTKRTSAPALKGGSMGPDGSTLIDLGGSGECGWRALACMIAVHNSPKHLVSSLSLGLAGGHYLKNCR